MEQLNKVELTGTVGSVNSRKIGDKVSLHFSVATNVMCKNAEGESVCETTWHNVRYFAERKDPLSSKVSKGAYVHILGRLRNYRYTGVDGTDRTGTEILASSVQVLEETRLTPQKL